MKATFGDVIRTIQRDLAFCDVCGRLPDRVLGEPEVAVRMWRFRAVCAHGAARIGTPEWVKAAKVEHSFVDEMALSLIEHGWVAVLRHGLKFFRRGFEQFPRDPKRRKVRPAPAYQRRRVRVALRRARIA